MTHKNRKKSSILMFLSTGCSLLRAEGFSCSLGVLYGGLGISILQFLINKIEIKFPAINFFQFQVIKPWIRIRDPESGSAIRKNAGSGSVSALNPCGSETLEYCTGKDVQTSLIKELNIFSMAPWLVVQITYLMQVNLTCLLVALEISLQLNKEKQQTTFAIFSTILSVGFPHLWFGY